MFSPIWIFVAVAIQGMVGTACFCMPFLWWGTMNKGANHLNRLIHGDHYWKCSPGMLTLSIILSQTALFHQCNTQMPVRYICGIFIFASGLCMKYIVLFCKYMHVHTCHGNSHPSPPSPSNIPHHMHAPWVALISLHNPYMMVPNTAMLVFVCCHCQILSNADLTESHFPCICTPTIAECINSLDFLWLYPDAWCCVVMDAWRWICRLLCVVDAIFYEQQLSLLARAVFGHLIGWIRAIQGMVRGPEWQDPPPPKKGDVLAGM